jgi:hypothetical protein
MFGRLYAASSGFILLSVPNAIGRGVFDTLQEPGLELPPGPDGSPYSAHITVMRPSEVDAIGGADNVNERGHAFPFNLGPLCKINNPGNGSLSAVYALEISSPELQQLRRTYGLPSLPTENGKEYPFHLTVGIRRKNVLRDNGISKHATLASRLLRQLV